jgi:hypothetical protein
MPHGMYSITNLSKIISDHYYYNSLFLIVVSDKKGPHLDRHQKDHPINLDKLIWTYPT